MAFATANSPANRKPGDNAQTATPPQAQARQRQSPGKAEPPLRAPQPPVCARARQRAPGRKPGGFAADHVLVSRPPPIARQAPARARTKTGLRSISRAKQRVPAAKNRQFCPAVVKRNDSSQTQGQNARFFALSEAHTRTTDKNVRFPLPRPRKTVCFDRQRPKLTVFASRTPPTANPILNKQRSRHQSRRWRAFSPGSRTPIMGIGFYHHRTGPA